MRILRLMVIILPVILIVIPTACAPHKKMTVAATALLVEDIAQAAYKQSDTRVIREGMPAYLMLMDGMVEAWPTNERLLMAAAQGYASFVAAFVADDDTGYAKTLYEKAKKYALRSLALRGIHNPATRPLEEFEADLKNRGTKDVPYLFWAATCWGNWIQKNLGSMEAMAELPRVEMLIKRVLELDEAYYYGGAHLFMGIWYASRPAIAGGDLNKAQVHFLRALELSEGKFFMASVYYADYYAKRTFNRELYVSILENVIAARADSIPELTLLNSVAKQKARDMLDRVDEHF